jgi:hypothetical protein
MLESNSQAREEKEGERRRGGETQEPRAARPRAAQACTCPRPRTDLSPAGLGAEGRGSVGSDSVGCCCDGGGCGCTGAAAALPGDAPGGATAATAAAPLMLSSMKERGAAVAAGERGRWKTAAAGGQGRRTPRKALAVATAVARGQRTGGRGQGVAHCAHGLGGVAREEGEGCEEECEERPTMGWDCEGGRGPGARGSVAREGSKGREGKGGKRAVRGRPAHRTVRGREAARPACTQHSTAQHRQHCDNVTRSTLSRTPCHCSCRCSNAAPRRPLFLTRRATH